MVTRTHDAAPKLNNIVDLMSDDFRAEVVERALVRRKKASGDLRQLFQSVLRKCVKIKGFRNPNRADYRVLLAEILRLLPSSADLVGAVLQVWMDSHAELYEIVCRRLCDLNMPAQGLDFTENCFAGSMDSGNWLQEAESLAASHSQFSKDEFALMLLCVSGNMPDGDEGDSDAPAESQSDAFFRQWLAELRDLPADASQWKQASDFVASATEIIHYKAIVRRYTQKYGEILAEINQEFVRELEFFMGGPDGRTLDQFFEQVGGYLLPTAEELEELLHRTESLKRLLYDYKPVHDIAPTVSEEAALWPRRVKLQQEILACIYHMHIMFADIEEDDEVLEALEATEASRVSDSAADDDQSDSVQPSIPVHGDESVLEPAAEVPYVSDTGKSSLESENSSLRQELQELRGELKTTQEVVKLWRVAYEKTRRQVAPTEEPPSVDELLPIENVRTAVALAREKYAGELLFQPNSKSEIEDNPYEKPTNVMAALEWLATTYYRSRMGEVSIPDLNSSIKKACGWNYIGSQSKNTMNRYKSWYTTGLEGKTYWLKSHVGTGSNKDSRYTIRIAFDWDSARQVVVIGYIGQHQQTGAT
ncbi:MAG: hypothetical protein F4X14_19985 [Caldilineaceae bacterium SB0661_bin_32]|uniref:Uncharacterized protein n=1 Tax=Caldilineaceae bacterium SB0661_bin_32 TaxID=2605255 RepID=A0A6B1DCU9_9CHLR|nr:hypothetical protein [Caldilineaceae bacterium SB0661_bin_32]